MLLIAVSILNENDAPRLSALAVSIDSLETVGPTLRASCLQAKIRSSSKPSHSDSDDDQIFASVVSES